jgi:hypothetical protein
MTESLVLPAILTATPEEIARAIYAAAKGKQLIVYRRRIWGLIMLLIRCLPERFFVRMRF